MKVRLFTLFTQIKKLKLLQLNKYIPTESMKSDWDFTHDLSLK